jgi:hypothetical protein
MNLIALPLEYIIGRWETIATSTSTLAKHATAYLARPYSQLSEEKKTVWNRMEHIDLAQQFRELVDLRRRVGEAEANKLRQSSQLRRNVLQKPNRGPSRRVKRPSSRR